MKTFQQALIERDLGAIRAIPKADLHVHALMGGRLSYISPAIQRPCKPLYSIADINEWSTQYLMPYCPGASGYLKRVEAAFVNAVEDGIQYLNMGFSLEEIRLFKDIDSFIRAISQIQKKFAPNVIFAPELSLKWKQNFSHIYEYVNYIFSKNWFKSIDICGKEELHYPIECYRSLYQQAKKNGLILKAHVGEFGPADNVMQAVSALELDQVNHGIAAARSEMILKYLADKKIQLNICPTANVQLHRIQNLSSHPIRKMFDFGIPVTINTDNVMVFDQTLSQEFLSLYNCGLMNERELDQIRLQGLKQGNTKKFSIS